MKIATSLLILNALCISSASQAHSDLRPALDMALLSKPLISLQESIATQARLALLQSARLINESQQIADKPASMPSIPVADYQPQSNKVTVKAE